MLVSCLSGAETRRKSFLYSWNKGNIRSIQLPFAFGHPPGKSQRGLLILRGRLPAGSLLEATIGSQQTQSTGLGLPAEPSSAAVFPAGAGPMGSCVASKSEMKRHQHQPKASPYPYLDHQLVPCRLSVDATRKAAQDLAHLSAGVARKAEEVVGVGVELELEYAVGCGERLQPCGPAMHAVEDHLGLPTCPLSGDLEV